MLDYIPRTLDKEGYRYVLEKLDSLYGSLTEEKIEEFNKWSKLVSEYEEENFCEPKENKGITLLDAKKMKTKHLYQRWYDSQWEVWGEWEEQIGRRLLEVFGKNEEDWKKSCKSWIEMGGPYEFKIVERTEEIVWEISYEN